VDVIPLARDFRYVKTRSEMDELPRPVEEIKDLYASVIHQVALRTMWECFAVTGAEDVVDTVVFNGIVPALNRATGQAEELHLISAPASRTDFSKLVLDQLEPEACLEYLKAILSPRPYDLEPVIEFQQAKYRFVRGRPRRTRSRPMRRGASSRRSSMASGSPTSTPGWPSTPSCWRGRSRSERVPPGPPGAVQLGHVRRPGRSLGLDGPPCCRRCAGQAAAWSPRPRWRTSRSRCPGAMKTASAAMSERLERNKLSSGRIWVVKTEMMAALRSGWHRIQCVWCGWSRCHGG
jgi:hypothetical protein